MICCIGQKRQRPKIPTGLIKQSLVYCVNLPLDVVLRPIALPIRQKE